MRRCVKKIKHKIDGMFTARKMSDTEHCVMCKVDTNVDKTLDISQRMFYIEGVGQFCNTCHLSPSQIQQE
jgi:hypothetical protein